ncbi:MAG: peptide chain release factor N(5)-glutamine methyltransferase [Gammaproteobacteria bacterium]|nr:peptide chain release factor N(5)-glutamine methyltransferase [Gammaproteobacteria bacterium]
MRLDQLYLDLCARLPDEEDAQFQIDQCLSHCDIPPTWRFSRPDHDIAPHQISRLRAMVGEVAAGTPLAYVLGEWEFFALPLSVSPSVLIPRADTETLVETLIKLVPTGKRLLDLGTGSGAIALALKHQRKDLSVTAIDQSEAALTIAKQNALALALDVEFVASDWFAALDGQRFDVIVSNPPYLASDDPHLEDLRHEPLSALVSGKTGLECFEHIAAGAKKHLTPGGIIAFEHGNTQSQAVQIILGEMGYDLIQSVKDLAGRPRVTFGYQPEA